MEEKTIDLNSLVVVEQLPKIRETLGVISSEIDKEIEYALALDCTEESKTEVKKYIMEDLAYGVTTIDARGGYTGNVVKMIMCTVPTKEYFVLKEGIMTIDPDAFFLVTDAYEVFGGKK